ncbi:hypothetical protein FI667_g2918, partial [Globisporangium splendens]
MQTLEVVALEQEPVLAAGIGVVRGRERERDRSAEEEKRKHAVGHAHKELAWTRHAGASLNKAQAPARVEHPRVRDQEHEVGLAAAQAVLIAAELARVEPRGDGRHGDERADALQQPQHRDRDRHRERRHLEMDHIDGWSLKMQKTGGGVASAFTHEFHRFVQSRRVLDPESNSQKMKCVRAIVVATRLVIASSAVLPQVDARSLRHDGYTKLTPARLKQEMHSMGQQQQQAVDERSREAPAPSRRQQSSQPSLLHSFSESILNALASMIRWKTAPTLTSEANQSSTKIDITAEVPVTASADLVIPAAASPSNKRSSSQRKGRFCLTRICSLDLFFASIWITFLSCFIVVYFLDHHLHRKHDDESSAATKKAKQESSEALQQGRREAARQPWIRQRISTYYQEVAGLRAVVTTMSHRRPPLGL